MPRRIGVLHSRPSAKPGERSIAERVPARSGCAHGPFQATSATPDSCEDHPSKSLFGPSTLLSAAHEIPGRAHNSGFSITPLCVLAVGGYPREHLLKTRQTRKLANGWLLGIGGHWRLRLRRRSSSLSFHGFATCTEQQNGCQQNRQLKLQNHGVQRPAMLPPDDAGQPRGRS